MYTVPSVIYRMLAADAASPHVLLGVLPSPPSNTNRSNRKHSPAAALSSAPPSSASLPSVPRVVSRDGLQEETVELDPTSMKLVYDVMRTSHGKILFKPPHLQRIAHSLSIATDSTWTYRHDQQPSSSSSLSNANPLPTPPQQQEDCLDIQVVEEALEAYLAHPDVIQLEVARECNLKFVAWPLAPQPGFLVFFIHSFFPPADWYRSGVRVGLLHDAARHDPSAKVVQSDLRTRALATQKALDAYEVLLVNPASQQFIVPEGSKSNYLLLTKDQRLLCSATEDILLGVTLLSVKEAAERAGLGKVVHQKLGLRDICDAQSVIVLGTSPGTLPVREIVLYRTAEEKQKVEAALGVTDGAARWLAQRYGDQLCTRRVEGSKNSNEDVEEEVVLLKEPRNEGVDRLMAAYEELSTLSYH